VVSLHQDSDIEAARVTIHVELAPLQFKSPVPIDHASLVSNISWPRAMPPPKRTSVPQSM
jgi:hypothetical protein